MKEIQFDARGDRLRICIEIGDAHIGSYRLRLWEPSSNTVVLDRSGNNQNPDDDCYELPLPTMNNNGRLVQLECSILSPDPKPTDKYSLALTVKQGRKILDKITEAGTMGGKRVSLELWATLIK